MIYNHDKSNLSKFITLFQAATKSFTNLSRASALAYTSAIALSSELEPNTRSARVPVHFVSPVAFERAGRGNPPSAKVAPYGETPRGAKCCGSVAAVELQVISKW